MRRLAVAAVSARMLAEAARADGFEVIALDLFGDADTRRAARRWLPIGKPTSLAVDGARLLQALQGLAQEGRVDGWIAGSGFEGRAELLAQGARCLPLLGTPPAALQRLRDPRAFFEGLDALGIAHPEVRMAAPAEGAGWLCKDAHRCGGWHIRHATRGERAPGPSHYFQRALRGVPMSATFVANGAAATVLGFNRQIVRPLAGRPYVWRGVIGPVPLPDAARDRIKAALQALVPAFGLVGLGSLDFLLDEAGGGVPQVLEINARPPASMALHGPGLVAAHVDACTSGALPAARGAAAGAPVRGTEIVFAPRALQLDDEALRRLQSRPDVHDVPNGALALCAGDPLCSVSARAADAPRVLAALGHARQALLHDLQEPVT